MYSVDGSVSLSLFKQEVFVVQRQDMILYRGVVQWRRVDASLGDDECTHIALRVSGADCDVVSMLNNITFTRPTILISIGLIGEGSADTCEQVACVVTHFFRESKRYRYSSVFILDGDQFKRVIPERVESGEEHPKPFIPSHILVSDG